MKILIVSNLYPPYYIGGYEIGCKDVADELRSRGHEIRVLTSTYQSSVSDSQEGVYRELEHSFPTGKKASENYLTRHLSLPLRQYRNRKRFIEHTEDFKPDLVFFWNLGMIGAWPFHTVARLGIRSAAYLSDEWLCHDYPQVIYRLPQKRHISFKKYIAEFNRYIVAKCLSLNEPTDASKLPVMFFTSAYIEQRTQHVVSPPPRSRVIHWGIHTDRYPAEDRTRRLAEAPITLLYAGQIVAHKGVRTAILAAIELIQNNPQLNLRFQLAGTGPEAYLKEIHSIVNSAGMQEKIIFKGSLSRKELRKELSNCDIFVFPSEWNEPFSIGLLEGLVSGAAVISTLTGGSAEIIEDGHNALSYRAGDVTDLVRCLDTLVNNQALRLQLGTNAREQIIHHYQMRHMVDEIEKELINL